MTAPTASRRPQSPPQTARGELPVLGARPERRDAAENRKRVLAAAQRLFDLHGIDHVSLEAVAAEAGVGKGTVFRRFGDRRGLLQALFDESVRAFHDALLTGPPPLGPGAAPELRLDAFVDAFIRLQHENLPIAVALGLASGPPTLSPLHVHLRLLLKQHGLTQGLDTTTTFLLAALAAPTLDLLFRRGHTVDAVAAAARAHVRAVVRLSTDDHSVQFLLPSARSAPSAA